MIGKLYIDGKDAYSTYGIFVANGGYNKLVAYPPLKGVETNDWHEEDGIEADLSSPKLDAKEFTINFSYNGSESMISHFFRVLSDKAYHTFEFVEMGKTYQLRLVSQNNLSIIRDLRVFGLNFADDFPLNDYIYQDPQSSIFPNSGYKIDDVDLSEYGVAVLQNTVASVLSTPAVKQNLLINTNSMRGAIYDNAVVTYKEKDVKINCLMRANSLEEFWRNYNALIYNLTKPNERQITIAQLDNAVYNCYYKQSEVTRFAPNDKIWFQFTLILVFTRFSPVGNITTATWDNFTNIWEESPLNVTCTWDNLINVWEEKPLIKQCTWSEFINIWVQVCNNDYNIDYSNDYNCNSPQYPYLIVNPTSIFVPEEQILDEDIDVNSNTDWNVE
ncbi:MAG: hypothetical protein LBK94_00740 [Prevotellaceae bacterium]|jgi:hypothetical protein|nr:hypothetical protein [Prevotellaceae bacterium]